MIVPLWFLPTVYKKKSTMFHLFIFLYLAFLKLNKDLFEFLHLQRKDFRILNFVVIYHDFASSLRKPGPRCHTCVPSPASNTNNRVRQKTQRPECRSGWIILEVLCWLPPHDISIGIATVKMFRSLMKIAIFLQPKLLDCDELGIWVKKK